MKDAVSSRIQMNSSTQVATSTLTVPASFRLAIRNIGIFALRARTARNSSVACSCESPSLAPCVQLSKMQRMPESDTTVARPSSHEIASTTSILRARNSDIRARTLREAALVVSASPASTIRTSRTSELAPARCIMTFPSRLISPAISTTVPDPGVTEADADTKTFYSNPRMLRQRVQRHTT